MKRTIIFAATLVFASVIPALSQTTDSDKLLQRLAAQSGGTAQVFVGKLPQDVPKVPLPDAALVGSVHQSLESPITVDSYNLFYDATPDTLKAYGAALVAAGWKQQPLMPGGGGGFVSSTGPTTAVYCKAEGPMITARIGEDPQDLLVTISPHGATSDILCGRNSITALVGAMMKTSLPPLHAPQGVRMSVTQIGMPNNQSAAYIHNGTSASDLLNGFASQLVAAGWHAGSISSGPSIASQTFTKADDKKALWQCLISVSAVDGKPGEFVAFITAADLDALSKGASTFFSH
jgi:hypothetical protein